MTDTLRGLLPKALQVLKYELESETPLPAAVHVLKACGLYGGSRRLQARPRLKTL